MVLSHGPPDPCRIHVAIWVNPTLTHLKIITTGGLNAPALPLPPNDSTGTESIKNTHYNSGTMLKAARARGVIIKVANRAELFRLVSSDPEGVGTTNF